MHKTYFGFTISDSMWPGTCLLHRTVLNEREVREILQQNEIISACNPRHVGSIAAMKEIFGELAPAVPTEAPQVMLNKDDFIIVMALRGLPRLTEARERSIEEVSQGHFEYALYHVMHITDDA